MTTTTASTATIADAEQVIRDLAATVISAVRNRNDHPTYGNTKTSIRTAASRLDGAIGLYMVLTGQAAHATVTALAEFVDPRTGERVDEARRAVESL